MTVENCCSFAFSAAPATVTSCPFQGLHRMIHYKQPECQGYIQSGCNGTSTMEVYSPCSSQPRESPDLIHLNCINHLTPLLKSRDSSSFQHVTLSISTIYSSVRSYVTPFISTILITWPYINHVTLFISTTSVTWPYPFQPHAHPLQVMWPPPHSSQTH